MKLAKILRQLGPGLLFAGAAVGVSHLVQSTKAGATFGFGLAWAVVLANLLKYPFFEFGTRYAAATGESLIEGYKKQAWWAMAIFIVMTLGTMFTIQAAVTIVTAGLAVNLFGFGLGALAWSAILLLICAAILLVGRYALLDNLMKFIIIVLSVSTVVAILAASSSYNPPANPETARTFVWNAAGITFIVALMGWMPAPIDLSIWSSIWSLEKKQLDSSIDFKASLLDFNVGYIGSALLALCFLTLGALVMYGSGETLSPKGGVFAGQIISIYTQALGSWAKPIISIAAFTTMFSTTITCLDAFPRVLGRTVIVLFPQWEYKHGRTLYWICIAIVIIGALLLLAFLSGQMGFMITIATVLSFLTAPFLAFINYRLVTGAHMPDWAKPPKWLLYLAWGGLLFLSGFGILYLATQWMQ